MSEVLQIHRDGRLLRIALDRPERRNALNLELCRELVQALEHADHDPAVGAILLCGNGKCFCAGAVQNAALAGGTGLVANCHVVIAREDAVFGLTEIRLGLWPFVVFRSVSAAVGERRSVELALTGRGFGAFEAKQMGLVHEVTPGLDERATEVATALANASPTAVASGLTFVQQVRGRDWKTAGEIARRIRNEVFESEDFREGLQAFLDKREAKWPSLLPTR